MARRMAPSMLLCPLIATALACGGRTADEAVTGMGGSSGAEAGGDGATAGGGSSSGTTAAPLCAEDTDYGTVAVDSDGAETLFSARCSTEPTYGSCRAYEIGEPLVYYLVDASASMLTPIGTSSVSRWEATSTALSAAIQVLPASFGLGIGFFPNMAISAELQTAREASACVDTKDNVVSALASSEQKSAAIAALGNVGIANTAAAPLHDAYALAVAELEQSALLGRRNLVLITDGQPTQSLGCLGAGDDCYPVDTEPLLLAIADAYYSDDIRTFVVGLPGTETNSCIAGETRDWLSDAAVAGQTKVLDSCENSSTDTAFCHYDLTNASELETALGETLTDINLTVPGCTYELKNDDELVPPCNFELLLTRDDGTYLEVLPTAYGTCSQGKGWVFNVTLTAVELCAKTCEYVHTLGQGSLLASWDDDCD